MVDTKIVLGLGEWSGALSRSFSARLSRLVVVDGMSAQLPPETLQALIDLNVKDPTTLLTTPGNAVEQIAAIERWARLARALLVDVRFLDTAVGHEFVTTFYRHKKLVLGIGDGKFSVPIVSPHYLDSILFPRSHEEVIETVYRKLGGPDLGV